jgi:hypothetical protein
LIEWAEALLEYLGRELELTRALESGNPEGGAAASQAEKRGAA